MFADDSVGIGGVTNQVRIDDIDEGECRSEEVYGVESS